MRHVKSEVSSVHVFEIGDVPAIRTASGRSFKPAEVTISLVGETVSGFMVTAYRVTTTGEHGAVRYFYAFSPCFSGGRIPLWLRAAQREAESIAKRRNWIRTSTD